MSFKTWLIALPCLALLACGPNVISENTSDGGAGGGVAGAGGGAGGGDNGTGGGTGEENPYPAGPYGVTVNRVIKNFSFRGYMATSGGTKVNETPLIEALDLQAFRLAEDANGKPFRYLLLDISGVWCPPCNQEAADLGLQGADKALIDDWASRGGLFFTVLVEGAVRGDPVLASDLDAWANKHKVQSSLAVDLSRALVTEGVDPSALPTNLAIDLKTMKIASAWYGLDTTYAKWEALLNAP